MTLVFGSIDLPVLETILIVSIIQIVGLILLVFILLGLLKEWKRLKEISFENKQEIERFEDDLKTLEKSGSGKKEDDSLKNFISENIKKGYSWDDLKKSLVEKGWPSSDLEKIYQTIKLKAK